MTTIFDQPAKGFKDLLEFPATLDFRIIVDAVELDALKKVQAALAAASHPQKFAVQGEPRISSNGKYISYTIRAQAQSAEELNAMYRAVSALSFVRHML